MKPVIVLLLFILVLELNARSIEAIQDSGEIIIAVYEDFPPYSYMEEGKPKGIDIEIGKHIATSLNVKPKWYFTGFDENLEDDLRNAISRGNLIHKTKADVMLRVPYDYDFIRKVDSSTGELSNDLTIIKSPYHSEKWAIATHTNKINELNTLGIFAYHKIGVLIDTLPEMYLNTLNRGLMRKNVKRYKSISESIKGFKSGEIDAIAGLESELEYFLDFQKNKDKYKLFSKLPGIKSAWDIGVAVRMDYRPLSYHVDGVINELYKKKSIEKIFHDFGLTYHSPISRQTKD